MYLLVSFIYKVKVKFPMECQISSKFETPGYGVSVWDRDFPERNKEGERRKTRIITREVFFMDCWCCSQNVE